MKLIKRNSEVDLPITSGCLYRKELMKEHFIRLVFDDVSDNLLEVGDYIIWKGVKYTLLKPYIPEQIEIGKYRYNVELQAPDMLWKQKYFVYKDADKDIETEWVMRADAHTWMQAIAKAIKLETGKDVTYKVSELLEGTQFIEIDHDTIFSGLNKIAEAFKTEWWYDGELHLSRCEHGDRIDLIVGDNVNAPKVEQKGDYFTRLIPLGSDRNIPQNTDATYVNYKNRLKLDKVKYPNGYIDVVDVPLEEVVPKTVIFEDIYPKSYLKISEVKSDYNEEDKQYVYSVKLENYTLTKDLILEELIPNISFRDGLLNGRTFELNVGEWLTLINQEEGGIIIPNKNLKPRVGDSIILTNIKMPDEYIKAAQEDLEYEALRVVARQEQDLNSYRIRTCPINFKDEIDVGSKVLLDDFGKETNTRVLSVEYNLDTPSSKELNIGNNITKGFIDRILEEAEIDKLKAQLKKGKDGNSVTLKGKLDSTDKLPTNPKKGDSYWIGTVLYTWNGIDWVTQDLQGEHGTNGSDGSTPYIGYNGNWWIGDSDLGIKAEGIDGDTPYIKDGYWWIGNRNTGVKADGKDGADGYTPYIENGYWYINGQNTGFVAKGEDGNTPYIGYNGNWFIDGQDTGMKSTGETGPITYMAGLYNDNVTYKGTITKRPVVYQPDNDLVPRVGSYYFLKNIGEFKGKSPRDNPTVWEKADEFNVILTDTLVAHFAKVGGAVFYGDLMMSQWGVDKDGNQTSNYDQYPDNFTPYLWFNFKTGDGSLNGNIEIGGNATFKGNLDGVSGSFKELYALDRSGSKKSTIKFDSDRDALWFSGDIYHQGYDYEKKRGYRFYTSDVWCRGALGVASMATIVINGTNAKYYYNGLRNKTDYIERPLARLTADTGVVYYEIKPSINPLSGNMGDDAGLHYNLIIINNTSNPSIEYNYSLASEINGKQITVMNTNDYSTVYIYTWGTRGKLTGGFSGTYTYLADFCTVKETQRVVGYGWYLTNHSW